MQITLRTPLALFTILAMAASVAPAQAQVCPSLEDGGLVPYDQSGPCPMEEPEWQDLEEDLDNGVEDPEPEIAPPVLVPPPELNRPLGLNPLRAAEPVGRLAADLNMYLGEVQDDVTAFITSPVLQARVPVGEFEVYGSGFELGVELPLLWIAPWSDPLDRIDGAIAIGNPMLSTHFIQALGEASYSLGFGVAIPLAKAEGRRGPFRALAYEAAIGNRSGHDMWLWSPDRLTVVLPARYEAFVDRYVLGVDGALGAMIYVGPGSEDTKYVTQIGAEMGYQVTPVSMIGLRALGHFASRQDGSNFAFGLEPGFRAQFGDGSFLGVRLTLPITEPYGFAFERGGNYALSFTIGREI